MKSYTLIIEYIYIPHHHICYYIFVNHIIFFVKIKNKIKLWKETGKIYSIYVVIITK